MYLYASIYPILLMDDLLMNMEERNPLEMHTSVPLPKRSLQSNKRGRPSIGKAVKFSSQPKSIISQLLNKIREGKCDYAKEEINSNEKKSDVPCSKISSQSDNTSQIQLESETEANLKQACIQLQESSSLDLTSPEDSHEGLNDSFLLHKHTDELNILQRPTHHNEKNRNELKPPEITCCVCSFRSNSHKTHRAHMSTHRNQPYNCNYPNCKYTCKFSSNLIKHKRIHTSEKPYLCDQCTFRSNFGNSLRVHKRTHTSERPYGCQYCSYRCNSSSNLKKHCLHRHRNMS